MGIVFTLTELTLQARGLPRPQVMADCDGALRDKQNGEWRQRALKHKVDGQAACTESPPREAEL